MSRIDTNVASLQAQQALANNQAGLGVSLQRLSTGLKINTGADDPAGLIASQQLKSETAGISQAIDNSTQAGNVLNTADGALGEISNMLVQVQSLNNQAANTGAESPQQIAANQLQVDSILNSINRISNTTQFNGINLLDGSLDYSTSNTNAADLANVRINAANLPDNGAVNVTVQVTASAKTGQVNYAASGIGAVPTTIELDGNVGTEQLSFAASAHNSAIAFAVNQVKPSTGVSATVLGDGTLQLNSTAYGSKDFVSVKTISGAFTNARNYGTDALVMINGNQANVTGTKASLRTGNLDISLDLTAAFAQTTIGAGATTAFQITGGGANFQLGEQVSAQSQENIGIANVSTANLGNSLVGFLSSMLSGGANSLTSGNTVQGQQILTASVSQVAQLRGRIGAFQKDVLQTNIATLNTTLDNVTSANSHIQDTDFAAETANLTRQQILVQAGTSVLSTANSLPQSVLSLLGH
jgi:flagellin